MITSKFQINIKEASEVSILRAAKPALSKRSNADNSGKRESSIGDTGKKHSMEGDVRGASPNIIQKYKQIYWKAVRFTCALWYILTASSISLDG